MNEKKHDGQHKVLLSSRLASKLLGWEFVSSRLASKLLGWEFEGFLRPSFDCPVCRRHRTAWMGVTCWDCDFD